MIYFSVFICIFCIQLIIAADRNSFDDSILFRLTWPGPLTSLSSPPATEENTLLITTLDNEKYHCTLPTNLPPNENINEKQYNGPSALELLFPLFTQLLCSYRLEQYWTYELCHGKYIKQYHEEKDVSNSKKLIRQEFVLGQYDLNQYPEDVKRLKEETASGKSKKIPTKKVEGQNLPYYALRMDDGTKCDLNNQPRVTNVLYVCFPDNKLEIYSFEEVSTCEYEMVVLTPFLCAHPDYRLKETVENDIQCMPVEGSPRRPLRLEQLELDSLRYARKSQHLKSVLRKTGPEEDKKKNEDSKSTPSDSKLVRDFLSGDYCLFGGGGWWKFEFCYGKKVEQYHEEKDSKKEIISLGIWNEAKHLKWLDQNPHKRPKKGLTQKQISHFYADGSICDISGRPRQVEVKFKCKESASHPNAVSLYLLEPKTCEYILVVESSILCALVDNADENGLFKLDPVVN